MRARSSGVPIAFAAFAAAFAAACDPSSKEVTAQYRPKADEMRAKIVRLAEAVDARPVKPGETCKPPKPLKFDPESDAHDTDFLSLEAAKQGVPYESGKGEVSKIRPQGPLRLYLIWLHPSHPWAQYNESVNESAIETIRRAEGVKYVVFTKEKAQGEELVVDWYLVDLEASQIVCAQSFTVPAEAKQGSDGRAQDPSERFAYQIALNLHIKVPK
jgi:hypothetical protein